MGEGDDNNIKAGALSVYSKYSSVIPVFYSSANVNLKRINSHIGVMTSGNFDKDYDWSDNQVAAALNCNLRLNLSKKHYIKLGTSVNFVSRKYSWTWPDNGYRMDERFNAEPSIWFGGDSSGFSFGVSANNLIGENYKTPHWTQGPFLFYIIRYEAGKKTNLQVMTNAIVFQNYKPYAWNDLNYQVEGVLIGTDLTYKKKYHMGLSGVFPLAAIASAGYTFDNRLKIMLSHPIIDPFYDHKTFEAMLAWKL